MFRTRMESKEMEFESAIINRSSRNRVRLVSRTHTNTISSLESRYFRVDNILAAPVGPFSKKFIETIGGMCPGQFYIRGRTKLRGHRDFRRWNSRHPGRSRFNRPRRGLDRWVSLTKRLLFNVTALPGYEIPRTIRFVHRNSTRFWFKCSVHSGGFCEVRVDLCHRHCISINFHAVRAYVSLSGR